MIDNKKMIRNEALLASQEIFTFNSDTSDMYKDDLEKIIEHLQNIINITNEE